MTHVRAQYRPYLGHPAGRGVRVMDTYGRERSRDAEARTACVAKAESPRLKPKRHARKMEVEALSEYKIFQQTARQHYNHQRDIDADEEEDYRSV